MCNLSEGDKRLAVISYDSIKIGYTLMDKI